MRSIATERPELVDEWHPTKNGELTPGSISFGSVKKVWWRCARGHEWEASPNNRSKGQGCPYCSGRRALVGFNDLATVEPDIAATWHPAKNGDLTPDQVTRGSHKRFGGSASVDMNGKPRYLTARRAAVAPLAPL